MKHKLFFIFYFIYLLSNSVWAINCFGRQKTILSEPEKYKWLTKYTEPIKVDIDESDKNAVVVDLKGNDKFKKKYGKYGKLEFYTVFSNDSWRFVDSYREGFNVGIYGSDITKYQYLAAKEKFPNLINKLPKQIIRDSISNETTLKYLDKALSERTDNASLLEGFLAKTPSNPNGRHTQRILDEFGMKAKSIHVITNRGYRYYDVYIDLAE